MFISSSNNYEFIEAICMNHFTALFSIKNKGFQAVCEHAKRAW